MRDAEAIARWAESRAGVPARADASIPDRLEQFQIVKASRRAGMTLPALAAEFGRDEVAIGRVLRDWTDTREAAKELINARAVQVADNMLRDADPSVALEILERIRVVAPKKGQVGGGVQIILNGFSLAGMPEPAIDAEVVDRGEV